MPCHINFTQSILVYTKKHKKVFGSKQEQWVFRASIITLYSYVFFYYSGEYELLMAEVMAVAAGAVRRIHTEEKLQQET